jgi:hypothetical protein
VAFKEDGDDSGTLNYEKKTPCIVNSIVLHLYDYFLEE